MYFLKIRSELDSKFEKLAKMRKIQYLSKGKGLVVKKANTFTYVFVKNFRNVL